MCANDRRLHLKKWWSQEMSVHRGAVLLTRLLPLDPCRRAFAMDPLAGVRVNLEVAVTVAVTTLEKLEQSAAESRVHARFASIAGVTATRLVGADAMRSEAGLKQCLFRSTLAVENTFGSGARSIALGLMPRGVPGAAVSAEDETGARQQPIRKFTNTRLTRRCRCGCWSRREPCEPRYGRSNRP